MRWQLTLPAASSPQMQLYENRSALEAAEAAKLQLQKENKALTVRREELQNKLNLTRKDMDTEGGEDEATRRSGY